MKKSIARYFALFAALALSACGRASSSSVPASSSSLSASSFSSAVSSSASSAVAAKPVVDFSFDSLDGETALNEADGNKCKVHYVFNKSNAANLFKAPSDPLLKQGACGRSLYLDGFSTYLNVEGVTTPSKRMTLAAWVAPRVFENLVNYDSASPAAGHPRLTSLINQGDMEVGEGFTFGYGRLGLWGIQLNLHSEESGTDFFVGYYDPLHSLNLYEWNFLSVSFDGASGYISLSYNGEVAYESLIPELANTSIISSAEPFYLGAYANPQIEFGIKRQMPSGLLDEVKVYDDCLSPAERRALFSEGAVESQPPVLPYSEVALDSNVYEGDRYRQQYHAIPPAVWMNEPHSPFYYKGYYHVFYQHNPSGPYWSQIRWAHIVSPDMIHWIYVKDAVVPTAGICPEGVWTGGACIGPDGTPWLAITAGTNTTTWTGQNVAFAHAVDPEDPYLVDWKVESTCVITQPSDDSMGEREQFRDPFVWKDGDTYYMMVSTSIPGAGGSANIFTSTNMRDWVHRGYLYQCDYARYPEQGAHWECVVMLPVSTRDGRHTKYVLFDCPQYTVDGYTVDCYYWLGTFNKETCRFVPDDEKPRLFDEGVGIFTGQNGFCYRTEKDVASGKSRYEDGRTILYAIAQGKSAGTAQNAVAGWAHSFAMPLELHLGDDLTSLLRDPIAEVSSLYRSTLYSYEGIGQGIGELNPAIAALRGDLLRIDLHVNLAPTSASFASGLYVRYNPHSDEASGYEKTGIVFNQNGLYIDRLHSSYLDYVDKHESYTYSTSERSFDVTILLDRSLLEVYVNSRASFTTRIYPKFSDSDFLKFFDTDGGLSVSSLVIREMGSAYRDTVTPAYYGNTGSITESELMS